MPEPSGEAIYAQVTRARSELAERFVFMTGGAFTAQGRHFLDTVSAPLVEKPFELRSLRALIVDRTKRS